MSTEENTPVESNNDDLDLFSAEFFGQNDAVSEPASEEETESEESESDANEDTHVAEDDTLAPDDDNGTEEEEESSTDETPKPKKNRFQERIDEVVAKQREAEREAETEKAARLELERKLAALEQNTKDESVTKTVVDDTGPKPTDTNSDGTEKYPLGEFDPLYIKDLMRHTLNEESRIRQENEKRQEEQRAREEAQAELQASWNEKLVPAKERYPDFQEKGQQMLGTFESIDEAYGEYLTTTIMDMEYGPDVFYYLANNLDEAQKIVQSGAKKATIALGRLEAKFADADEKKQRARPKVSSAAPPPPRVKGSEAVKPVIKGDEKDVDLDAFAREFFKKK